jgi:NTP pyrophosphatase (non-canonical NTP hydrolase)
MTTNDQTLTALTQLQQHIFDINESKGFHDDRPKPMRIGSTLTGQKERQNALANWQGNKLLLIVSEVAEAQDEIRKGRAADETYYPTSAETAKHPEEGPHKPEGVPSEIADVVIRCFDFAATEGFDLGQIIAEKLAYNNTRPFMHGKKF